ncbi:hypothetical protein FVR03_20415 [Pontibacter qinzhouensis]|uniref:Uncharacterized protein n=1 Tax=Pontibacter qinzhouensis TaxID=2603253 RepID=A0A5C8J1M1_9BACT|nr:hypothetical protein [Pontibacter qinzhouensis]TXK29671.1 hypothetical protein FVR03_20415 [Pontibacter qinzhouensis]
MLHFSKISSKGKDFNIIASGALAFKIHNKILKDECFEQDTSISRHMLLGNSSMPASTPGQKKIFFVIISDLDKINTASLCRMIAKERANGGYAVCQIIPMLYNEPSFRALKMLRQSFDEVLELGKFTINTSKVLVNTEQQNCIITDYSLSMARIMYQVCLKDFSSAAASEPSRKELAYAGV